MIAIDLGSNTVRVVQMDCARLEPSGVYEKIVATADALHESGKISEAAVERIVGALNEAKERLDFKAPVVAVTTEALRIASNRDEVLGRIESGCGIAFRVISGEEEAFYTSIAVKHRLERVSMASERFVLVDIGGGSTEIIFVESEEIRSRSFPVGIVTVAQKYKSLDRISEELPGLMKDMVQFVADTRKNGAKPELFVSTAGTPTTIAAMKLGMNYETYDAGRINGTVLNKDDLKIQLDRLMGLDRESRQRLVGVGREDLIAAGVLIFEELFSILGFDESVVIDDGLREGVAIAACKGLLNGSA